jgi:outer membrane assembly lipoprotein YfiO
MIKNLYFVSSFYACVLFFTASCSTGNAKNEVPHELATASENDEDEKIKAQRGETELLAEAKKLFSKELYSLSQEYFKRLRDLKPNGPFSDYAHLKYIDSIFFQRDFKTAVPLYVDFAERKPSNPAAPYALFRAAEASELSYAGAGRDPSPLLTAKKQYVTLLKEYPNSPYAYVANKHLTSCEELLSSYHQKVSEFYTAKESYKAARSRLELSKKAKKHSVEKELLQKVPQTTIIAETRNFDSTRLEDRQQRKTLKIRTSNNEYESKISRISCQNGNDIVLTLRGKLEPTLVRQLQGQSPNKIIVLPYKLSNSSITSCGAYGRFIAMKNGTLVFSKSVNFSALVLKNPERILLLNTKY